MPDRLGPAFPSPVPMYRQRAGVRPADGSPSSDKSPSSGGISVLDDCRREIRESSWFDSSLVCFLSGLIPRKNPASRPIARMCLNGLLVKSNFMPDQPRVPTPRQSMSSIEPGNNGADQGCFRMRQQGVS